MPQTTKRQHYVPRCYLRRFTQDGTRLFVFDKTSGKSFRAGINNVATSSYFYDLPVEIGQENIDVQAAEKLLSDIETDFAQASRDLLRAVNGGTAISARQRRSIAIFVALQHLRTAEARQTMVDMTGAMAEALKDIMAENGLQPEAIEVRLTREGFRPSQSEAQLQHLHFMFDSPVLGNLVSILEDHFWIVGINQTTCPLYTSDHPVVRHGHVENPLIATNGFASPGVEIAFPLDPHHILIFVERSHWSDLERLDGGTLMLRDTEFITFYNSLQVCYSHRQVFSPSDDFTLAREMCRERPELADPKRLRVGVANPHRRRD